jgi:CBS domain-containing protein
MDRSRRHRGVDPLEATFVWEIMRTRVFNVDPNRRQSDGYQALAEGSPERRQRLFPVLDEGGRLVGVLPWSAVLTARSDTEQQVREVTIKPVAVAYPDEILRVVADRMAASRIGVIPVVDRLDPGHLDGLITQFDLLQARQKLLEEERHAERVLTLEGMMGRRSPEVITAAPADDDHENEGIV